MDDAGDFDKCVVHEPAVPYLDDRAAAAGVVARAERHATTGNDALVNLGWERRRVRFAQSRRVQFCVGMLHDFYSADRLLLPGVSYVLELERNEQEDFALIYPEATPAGTYRIKINKLVLMVKKVLIRDDLASSHKRFFASHDCPFYHTAR
jgi:hypothetical protein